MIEAIKSIDTNIFLFLNGFYSAFFDNFMYAFSYKWTWIPFYISLLYIIIKNWKKESIYLILALIVCITLADQIASGVLKNWIARPRPSHAENLTGLVHIVNDYRGGRFGFVSSHAANSLALAVFCSFLFRQKTYTWILLIWALLTGYSRIYLGVHYPLDILGGFLVGLLAALFCLWLLKKIRPQVFDKRMITNHPQQNTFTLKFIYYLPLWILLFTLIGIVIYSIAHI